MEILAILLILWTVFVIMLPQKRKADDHCDALIASGGAYPILGWLGKLIAQFFLIGGLALAVAGILVALLPYAK